MSSDFAKSLHVNICSGQISSRPHTSFGPPKGSVLEGKSLISEKSRLVKYYNLLIVQPWYPESILPY